MRKPVTFGGPRSMALARRGRGPQTSNRYVCCLALAVLLAPVVWSLAGNRGMAGGSVAASSSGPPPQYSITQVGHGIGRTVIPTAINSRGTIVGELAGRTTVQGFAYEDGGLRRVAPPRGFTQAEVLDVNDGGVMTVAARTGMGPWQVYFVGRLHASGPVWSRIRAGAGGTVVSVGAIAPDGDVAGAVRMPGSAPKGPALRAAVWSPSRGGYSWARLLPLSGGFARSTAATIWSSHGETIVAGVQQYPSRGAADVVTVWSRPRNGRFRVFVDGPGHTVTAIGGTRKHLFTVGIEVGVDTVRAWAGRVSLEHGYYAAIRSTRELATGGRGGLIVRANGVVAGTGGKLLAVGEMGDYGDGPPIALRWSGRGPGAALDSFLPSHSGWTLRDATAVNARGQIVGTGILGSRPACYVLTPVTH